MRTGFRIYLQHVVWAVCTLTRAHGRGRFVFLATERVINAYAYVSRVSEHGRQGFNVLEGLVRGCVQFCSQNEERIMKRLVALPFYFLAIIKSYPMLSSNSVLTTKDIPAVYFVPQRRLTFRPHKKNCLLKTASLGVLLEV